MSQVNSFCSSIFGSNDNSSGTCSEGTPRPDYTYYIIWGVSLIIIAILAIAQKRVGQRCPNCCYGRPGFPVPIDFLVSPRRRFMYTILFANMGASIISGYNNYGINLETDNFYAQLFNKILWAPFLTVLTRVLEYFPLFATVEFPYLVIGFPIGFLYSLLWFANTWVPRFFMYHEFVDTCSSEHVDRATVLALILQDLPLVLMGAFIIIWFFCMTVFYCCWKPCPFYKKKASQLINKYKSIMPDSDEWHYGIQDYHLDRVKYLLQKPIVRHSEPDNTTTKNIIVNKMIMYLSKVVKYLFPFKKNYKLPLPLLGAIVSMVMIIYQLSCRWLSLVFFSLVQLRRFYDSCIFPIVETLMQSTSTSMATAVIDFLNEVSRSLLIGIPAVFAVAPFVSLLLSIFLLIHFVASVSKDVKKASKRGFQAKLPSRVRRLTSSWKYIGVQVGLFIYAWVIYTLVFTLIGLVLIVAFFFLKYRPLRDLFFNAVLFLAIPPIWSSLLYQAQTLICYFIFMDDRKEKDSKFIAVTNRHLYNWFGFVVFFYNGFAGLVSAFLRMIISIVFGLVFMFRLDKLSLPPHLWNFDIGHKDYLGFLYIDYCYNNPVMHVFTCLLQNSIKKDSIKERYNSDVELVGADRLEVTPPTKKSRHILARNRWLVAYTLIRNPSIQQYTANHIRLLAEEKEKDKTFVLTNTIKSASDKVVLEEWNLGKKEKEGVEIQPTKGNEAESSQDGKALEGKDVLGNGEGDPEAGYDEGTEFDTSYSKMP